MLIKLCYPDRPKLHHASQFHGPRAARVAYNGRHFLMEPSSSPWERFNWLYKTRARMTMRYGLSLARTCKTGIRIGRNEKALCVLIKDPDSPLSATTQTQPMMAVKALNWPGSHTAKTLTPGENCLRCRCSPCKHSLANPSQPSQHL